MFRTYLLPAFRMITVLTILAGLLYPAFVTLAATALFPTQAAGSLLYQEGQNQASSVVGSALIGQANQDERYFWPRPSAVNYMVVSDGATVAISGASNAALTSKALADTAAERATHFRTANGLAPQQSIPAEMLFASGSGLDPHISPEAALLQVGRIAAARQIAPTQLDDLVIQYTEAPQFGFLGPARVNVLLLNLALDRLQS